MRKSVARKKVRPSRPRRYPPSDPLEVDGEGNGAATESAKQFAPGRNGDRKQNAFLAESLAKIAHAVAALQDDGIAGSDGRN